MSGIREWPKPLAAVQHGPRARMGRHLNLAAVLLLAAAAHMLALRPGPGWPAACALIVLLALLPGALLVRLLPLPRATWLDRAEAGLYAVGAGYTLLVLGMWGLSLLPGPLAGWQVLALFDLLIVLLAVAGWLWPRPAAIQEDTPLAPRARPWQLGSSGNLSFRALGPQAPRAEASWRGISLLWLSAQRDSSSQTPRNDNTSTVVRRYSLLGVASVLLVAVLLRFPNLGYSDFQGDEARALLRAAELIQGYPSALLIHKKGPVEILLPAALYAPLGNISEAQARLPFALANLAGILAIYLLGWRMAGPLAGWAAAMLLAVDGYLVGFSRIVQYQSIIFLMSALVVLALYRQWQMRRAAPVYLWLAALCFTAGLLAHYEALWALIPGGYLLVALTRQGERPGRLLRAMALPALAAGSALALFYVPFVLDARFAQTADDIFGNRIGSRFPYNNLADFFLRTTIYSASYYVLLLIGVTVIAWTARVRCAWPAPRNRVSQKKPGFYPQVERNTWLGWSANALLLAGLAVCTLRPGWFVLGGTDWTWLLFAAAIGLAVGLPGASVAERTAWLWFGVPLVLSLFFVAKPNSHVYGFFSGWALVVGMALAQGWQTLAGRAGLPTARIIALPAAAALALLFAHYAYQFFVRSDVEVLRTWTEHRPAGYWTPYALPDRHSLFGFPYKNGWKVVGALYAEGMLDAPFDSNETSRVADWYGRGLFYCPPDAEYYMAVTSLQPGSQAEDQALLDELAQRGYHDYAQVTVNGDPRLRILTTRPVSGPVQQLDEAVYAPVFDAALSGPDFLKNGPVPSGLLPGSETGAPITPVDYRLGDAIRLAGYSVDRAIVAPGEKLHVRLYWQTSAPVEQEYKVFVQLIDLATTHKAAQRDSEPGCTKYATDEWRAGDLNLDPYTLTLAADAPPGAYTLLVGMYDAATGERLPVTGAGALGDAIPLTTVQVSAP